MLDRELLRVRFGINYRPRWKNEDPILVQVRCCNTLLGVPESLWV